MTDLVCWVEGFKIAGKLKEEINRIPEKITEEELLEIISNYMGK